MCFKDVCQPPLMPEEEISQLFEQFSAAKLYLKNSSITADVISHVPLHDKVGQSYVFAHNA